MTIELVEQVRIELMDSQIIIRFIWTLSLHLRTLCEMLNSSLNAVLNVLNPIIMPEIARNSTKISNYV